MDSFTSDYIRTYIHLQFINPYALEGSSQTFMYVLLKFQCNFCTLCSTQRIKRESIILDSSQLENILKM